MKSRRRIKVYIYSTGVDSVTGLLKGGRVLDIRDMTSEQYDDMSDCIRSAMEYLNQCAEDIKAGWAPAIDHPNE